MLLAVIDTLILFSVSALINILILYPPFLNRGQKAKEASSPDKLVKRPKDKSRQIDRKQLLVLFSASPVITAMVASMLFSKNLAATVGGALLGLLFPVFWFRDYNARLVKKFEVQLPDSLMILTSCLRGGLSLIQAVEVLTEEMPWPTNSEFGSLLKENKMGISLEESLRRLNKRIPSDDLILLSSAIMVSRETGGDLTEVFTRLNDSIRARNKLLENVKTLTLQGKIQSIILSALPIVFTVGVFKVNPTYFQLMINSQAGRMMLVLAGCLLIAGLFLIRVFSKVEV